MTHRSRAPLRIGLAGGGTDVSPFSELYGGEILNASINLYAHASITPRNDGKIVIHAVDKKLREEFTVTEEIVITSDALCLQKGVYNRIVKQFTQKSLAFELVTAIDVAAGSGLGTSSTLVIAILGAFVEWLKLPLGEYEIAQLAYSIEREDLTMAGGKQDQYAAAFGGINFMEFHKGGAVIVNPLRIKSEILQELEFHLLLFYTQTTRASSKIIAEQKRNVENKEEDSILATQKLKEQVAKMKEALLKGEIAKIGEILNQGWHFKKQMAKGISNNSIDKIYKTAIDAGASGGKISGAGGGGFMVFYAPGNSRYTIIEALSEIGVEHQRYNFSEKGLTKWTRNQ